MAFGIGSAGDSLRKNDLGILRPTTKKSYQRFFDGWVEYRETDGRGRSRKKLLYVADYHVCDLEPGARIGLRALYAALLLLAIAAFLSAGVRYTAFNMTWYVGLPTAAACLLLGWTAVILVGYYIPGAKRMTNFTYQKAVPGLRTGAKLSAFALGLCALATLFSLFFHREDVGNTFFCAALFCGAGTLMAVLYFVEGKVGYHLEPSGSKAPVGSIYIATMEEVLPPRQKAAAPGTITNEDLFAPEPIQSYAVSELRPDGSRAG